jgi:hypothetical protein
MAKRRSDRKIIVPAEFQQKQADRDAAKIQAFSNELGQVQSRRLELTTLLLQAAVTRDGLPGSRDEMERVAAAASDLARWAIERDCMEKWTALRDLFAELDFEGPQPHLEWAAKKVGVTLFEESRILQPTEVEAPKVIQ